MTLTTKRIVNNSERPMKIIVPCGKTSVVVSEDGSIVGDITTPHTTYKAITLLPGLTATIYG